MHDYFEGYKKLDNIIWDYHTTQGEWVLEKYYPGDEYVEIIGESAYGKGLIFKEYEWVVEKKKNVFKIIWWAEFRIRGRDDAY